MSDKETWHGTPSGYTNRGCRCEGCRSAASANRKELRALRIAQGLPDGDPRHGTYSAYINWNCRCAACSQAHTARRRAEVEAATPLTYNLERPAKSTHPLWQTYVGMMSRCGNPKADNYRYYGGRGITVCEAWSSDFWTFVADMGPKPDGTTVDRIDVDGPYSKANCRWADASTQMSNRRIKTHCHNGHPFDEENTAFTSDGKRRCRTCARAKSKRSYYAAVGGVS